MNKKCKIYSPYNDNDDDNDYTYKDTIDQSGYFMSNTVESFCGAPMMITTTTTTTTTTTSATDPN
jgi:hypothetical protein